MKLLYDYQDPHPQKHARKTLLFDGVVEEVTDIDSLL
jgi:hypothetical protein